MACVCVCTWFYSTCEDLIISSLATAVNECEQYTWTACVFVYMRVFKDHPKFVWFLSHFILLCKVILRLL